VAFTGISADVGVTETLMAGTVICTEFDFDVSVIDVAVSVAVRLLAGASAGALYVTDVLVALLSDPTPVAGDKLQVTPELLGSLLAVAVKSCVVLAATVAELGEMETAIAGTVTVTRELFVASVTEVAVMVTTTSLGGALPAALNVTDVFVTSLSVPPPDAGEMLQTTPALLGSLVTVAVKLCLVPAATVAPPGFTEITIARTTTLADADIVGVAAEVAVMVIAKSFDGGLAGALKVTEVLVASLSVPVLVTGEIVQLTPEFEASFCTAAVNGCAVLATTFTLSGDTVTTMAARFSV